MKVGSRLLPALAIGALLIAAIACDTGEGSLSASELAGLTQYNQGIRVTGTGTVSVAPDVAMLGTGRGGRPRRARTRPGAKRRPP